MAKQNLATVTNDLIASYGKTAKNVISAYHLGNQRAVSYADQSWASAVKKAAPRINAEVRNNAIAAQKKMTSYYAKGVMATADGAVVVVDKAMELAGKGVVQVASNASRFEQSTGMSTLTQLAVASLPAAQAAAKAADKLELQSRTWAQKAAGSATTAKAASAKRAVAKTVRKVAAKVAA
jgi:hypothetical protein